MAKSGLIKNDFSNYYRIQIAWEITSQNIANNTSNVAVKVQLVSLNPNANIVSNTPKNGKLNINGVWYPFTFNTTLAGNQTKTLFTKTVTINHDSNGSKTCSLATECSINVTLSGVYVGTVKATGSGTFDTIPRATVPTLSNDKPTMGNTITITLSRASSEFTHTVKYAWGKDLVLIAKNVTTSTSWTIPLELANGVPNGLTGSGAIVCETYKGSILIGSERVPFSATVPTSVKPTITNITITEAATGLAEKIEAFVQGRSKLSVVVSANGVYGGTIKSYKTTVNGTVYTSGTFETETLLKSGQMDVTTTVTDSRGRSATLTRSINVLAYEIPSISSLSAYRVNETGEKNDEGTFCKVDLSFIISSLNDKNDKSYALDIQESGATEWIPLESGSVYAYNGSYTDANGILNADKPYRVRLTVSDYFTSVTRVYEIPTAYTLLDVHSSCRGIAFGKVSEIEGLFDEAIPALFRSEVHFSQSPTFDVTVFTSGSINDAVIAGTYYLANEIIDRPVQLNGWLEVRTFKNYVYQKYTTYTGKTFERIMDAGVWGDWCGVFTSGMWSYEKRLDGSLKCWGELVLNNIDFNVKVADSWYRPSSNNRLDYPVSFNKTPILFFSTSLGNTSGSVLTYIVSSNQTSSTIWLQKMVTGVANLKLAVQVIGTWK